MRYDRDTERIIARLAKENKIKNCVDVGVLDGEILELFIKYVPKGQHYGVEPLPHKFELLQQKFGDKVQVLNYALGAEDTQSVFNYVVSNPSYSGLKQRKYPKDESIRQIDVEVRRLDGLIKEQKIDFIKIDVEGAEYNVLQGASKILENSKPYLVFEFGLGAADYYEVEPEAMFDYLSSKDYQIFLLKDWLQHQQPLGKDLFIEIYKQNKEYYYLAEHK